MHSGAVWAEFGPQHTIRAWRRNKTLLSAI
jgi:hypothetical protein